MSKRLRRVALIYDARVPYDLKVMGGVASYVQEIQRWNVYIEENALKDQRLPELHSWKGDGIIADFDHPKVAAAVVQSKLPAVGFGSGYGWYMPKSLIPYFFTNNNAIAQLAADHLLSRGLRHFAYCGYPRNPINGWSEERERAFIARVESRGFSCAAFHGHHKSSQNWTAMQRSLGEWLISLPKPAGLLAANDNRGRQVLEACRACKLRVPEDLAVIGVDNDELLCNLSSPLLSSIEQGAKRLGYDAATLLEAVMDGKKLSATRWVIDPVEVVTRRSTEILAIDEPILARATAYISEHFVEGIKVQDVVKAVGVSRSGLETHFKTALGYTVHSAIRRMQLDRSRRLISDTNLPLKQIAANLGFRSIQHLTTVFGKAFGQSPARFRQMGATLWSRSSIPQLERRKIKPAA